MWMSRSFAAVDVTMIVAGVWCSIGVDLVCLQMQNYSAPSVAESQDS